MDLRAAYRSEVFKQYNKARGAARRGQLDKGRVNRALGLLMSKRFMDKVHEYGTTYQSCHCPDYEQRTVFCKHRLAFVMNWRAMREVISLVEAGKVEFPDDPLAY